MINLSNSYNLNFWRKISNIILKNIFIILHQKKFIIIQNKSWSILEELQKNAEKFKGKDAYRDICQKFEDYKKSLSGLDHVNNPNKIAPSADKERKFNLIIIYKDEAADIDA